MDEQKNLGIVMQALQRHEDAETAFLWAREWEQAAQSYENCREMLLLAPVIALDEDARRARTRSEALRG